MNRRTLTVAGLAAAGVLLAIGALALARGGDGGIAGPGARHTVLAPIDGLDIQVLESSPPQYRLVIRAGLPSGCAMRHSHDVSRSGETITVTVLNSMPTGDPVCTMIYGTYELNIDLGSDFRSGATYTVRVNDREMTFTAQ
ncbi:MAG: hypothetical protein ACRDGE_11540 [Candidatus Limnocylindria bacterium]